MGNAIRLKSQCNKSHVLTLNRPQLVYVLVEILSESTNVRMPLNFTLVLDCSGSMRKEKKLGAVEEAVKNVITLLEPDDTISVVTFCDTAKVVCSLQPGTQKMRILQAVNGLRAGGGTRMEFGLREALRLVNNHPDRNQIQRIVLLTDGRPNNVRSVLREADNAGAVGLPIIGLGFGSDWKEDFLIELADRSLSAPVGSHTGIVHFIRFPEQAKDTFLEVYQNMQIVAQQITVTLRLVEGLEVRRAWQVVPMIRNLGYNTIQGRAVVIPIGDIERGGAAYLFELMLPPRPVGMVRFAQADATYSLPNHGQQRELIDLVINYTFDPSLTNQTNGHVMNVVEKVQAFKLQTQALDEAEIGNVSGATKRLRQAVTILLSQGENDLAQQMKAEADRLEQAGGGDISGDVKKTIKLTSRKTIKLSE